jgi:ribosomal protein S18 acetylase RimI-like enzyme
VIRRATPEDAEAIAALFRRSFGTLTFLPTLHTPEEDRRHFARLVERAEVWVADEEGGVLGFLVLAGDELDALYVEPGAQDRGIGSALFAHAQAERPAGFCFWVFQRNDRARRFYERRGCRLVRLTDGRENEEREPDALYEWRPGADEPRSPARSRH